MAKIYETSDDLKRDQLQAQADELKLKSSRQDYWALSMLGGGLVASLYSDRGTKPRTGLKYLSTGLTIAGIVEWVRSWGTSSKASTLEMHSKLTGTGEVIVPREAAPATVMLVEKDCGCHLKHEKPKSLLEYAAKSGGMEIGKN